MAEAFGGGGAPTPLRRGLRAPAPYRRGEVWIILVFLVDLVSGLLPSPHFTVSIKNCKLRVIFSENFAKYLHTDVGV